MDALSKGQPVNVKLYKPFACIGKLINWHWYPVQ